jgi:hypothetical protein
MPIIPLSAIGFIINFLVFFFSAVRLWRTYKRDKVPAIKHLSLAFFSFAIFTFTMIWPHIFWKNPESFQFWMHESQLIGFVFLIIFYIFFTNVAYSFRWQKAKKPILALVIILGIAFLYLNYAFPNQPQIDQNTGLTSFNDDGKIAPIVFPIAVLSLLSFFVVFLLGALKAQTHLARRRGIALALGALFIFIGGPLHSIATTPLVFLIGDVFLVIASLSIGYGVLFLRSQQNSEPEKNGSDIV